MKSKYELETNIGFSDVCILDPSMHIQTMQIRS